MVTKAGFVPYLCTKSMPGKMPTPTCCQRKRPATCIKFNVGITPFTFLQTGVFIFLRHGVAQVNLIELHPIVMKWGAAVLCLGCSSFVCLCRKQLNKSC